MSKVSDALEAIRNKIHEQVKDFGSDDYRNVLENLHCDIEGMLEALDGEEDEE